MQYIVGDIINTAEKCIIIHPVNCQGVITQGFSKKLTCKYPLIIDNYNLHLKKYKEKVLALGSYFVTSYSNQHVISIVIQLTYGGKNSGRHVDYCALKQGLEQVNVLSGALKVYIPYLIGCGNSGGDWSIVEKIIENSFNKKSEIYIVKPVSLL